MKKLFKVFLVLIIVVAVLGTLGYVYLLFAFPKIADVQADLKIEATPERLERGKYLAHTFAGCIECHSDRDFTKFGGPVVPGTEGKGGFDHGGEAGTIPASNITQDKETGIGGWSDGELFRAITEGIDKDGKFLAPMMPYTEFAKMDKEDVYSVIAYIKTLPAVKNQVAERSFNFPLHLIFRTIPTGTTSFTKRPDPSDKVKLGEYYGVACKFCHSPGEKGDFYPDKLFSGGTEFPMPDGTIIRSSNISPDKETGIGGWTKEMFIAKFRILGDHNNVNMKSLGYNSPMAWPLWGGYATDEDLGAVYDYLMSQKPVNNKVEKVTLQGMK